MAAGTLQPPSFARPIKTTLGRILALVAAGVVLFFIWGHRNTPAPQLANFLPAREPAELRDAKQIIAKPTQPAIQPQQIIYRAAPSPAPTPSCNDACQARKEREQRYETAIRTGFGTATQNALALPVGRFQQQLVPNSFPAPVPMRSLVLQPLHVQR